MTAFVGTQTRLSLWARNDLPPKWDGRRVDWSEWNTDPMFVCVRPASLAPRGTVYPLDGEMFETHEPRVKRTRSGREYQAGVQIVTANWRNPVTSIVAFRCPGCGLDEVFDMDTEECWTLDGSDYGDEGSTA